jgi:trimethylamine:corrinoid methyltransferase-like protein
MAIDAKGVTRSENGQALDVMHEVGSSQHFLGCTHSRENFKTEFSVRPLPTTMPTNSGSKTANRMPSC